MTISNILAIAGCALVIIWFLLRYMKVEGQFTVIPAIGLVLLIASLLFT
ncbi:hypothetical protein JK159_02090 [Weissella minor]|nr:hypothetical protein [Weissella minor]MBS0949173.1 hypothetical protein [Weissella minor]